MSSRSSLLKRAAVPLLTVAATALCGPTRAATATLDYCQLVQITNQGQTQMAIGERVKCSITDDSRWQSVTYHAQQLGGGNNLSYTPLPPPGSPPGTPAFDIWGPGDFYQPGRYYATSLGPIQHGTYNCWAVCSGPDYYGVPWNASTGGNTNITY